VEVGGDVEAAAVDRAEPERIPETVLDDAPGFVRC
jgi:hypothetical protein